MRTYRVEYYEKTRGPHSSKIINHQHRGGVAGRAGAARAGGRVQKLAGTQKTVRVGSTLWN